MAFTWMGRPTRKNRHPVVPELLQFEHASPLPRSPLHFIFLLRHLAHYRCPLPVSRYMYIVKAKVSYRNLGAAPLVRPVSFAFTVHAWPILGKASVRSTFTFLSLRLRSRTCNRVCSPQNFCLPLTLATSAIHGLQHLEISVLFVKALLV